MMNLSAAALLALAAPVGVADGFSPARPYPPNSHRASSASSIGSKRSAPGSAVGPLYYEGRGEYYGEASSSFVVREFGAFEQLEEIVKLTARPLPERPDGIVCVAKFTSSEREGCRKTEAEYERIARANPATCFLRCFEEYENADMLLGQAEVRVLPSFDIFYGGKRVARVEGNNHPELEDLIERYQFQNSKLDLFSEDADNQRRLQWGDGKVPNYEKTPRTTARFIPGYDWDKDGGFFDELANNAQEDWDDAYGNWVPDVEDK